MQAEAYERRLRRVLKTACSMSSCQRRDVGVEFLRFIFPSQCKMPYTGPDTTVFYLILCTIDVFCYYICR